MHQSSIPLIAGVVKDRDLYFSWTASHSSFNRVPNWAHSPDSFVALLHDSFVAFDGTSVSTNLSLPSQASCG